MLSRASLCNDGKKAWTIAVAAVLTPVVLWAGTPEAPNLASGPAGGISGKVVADGGQPVADAAVILCDQAGGIPLASGTFRPFVEVRTRMDILFSTTDSDGRFAFEKVPVGSYRLVAQSWRDKASIQTVLEVNGEEIELHGLTNNVQVTEGRTVDVILRPLGTGSLRMDQQVPNDETFLVLSMAPTRADPILGFMGWTGPFLQQAIGGNRMPGGRTVVHGLPEGTIYLAMFAMDNVPGFLDASVPIKAGQTTVLPVTPFVAGWSDGRHNPPPELRPIYEEMKAMPRAEAGAWFLQTMREAGIQMDSEDARAQLTDNLDKEIVLPSGRKATVGKIMAAVAYAELQETVARRTARSHPDQSAPPKPAAPSELQRLIDAAGPGTTVVVPKGTYTVPVQITKPLTLKGPSPDECLLEVTANEPALFIDGRGKGDISVEGLTIKWQLATSDKGIERPVALAVKDATVSMRNCRFVPLGNTQRSPAAVRIDGFSKATISDCRFEGFDFVINYGPGAEGLVEGCILRNGGHQGVTGYDGSTLRVERTIVAGFKYHGLRCTGGTLHAKDNVLIDNHVSGVYMGNKDGQGTIANNLMIGNSEAVAAFYRAQFQIHNNVILDSTLAGIGMWDTCRLNISDNIFQGNPKAMIVYPKSSKDTNTIGVNAFWRNTTDAENCRLAADSILADPFFQDPDAGDYSLRPGASRDRKQGLTDPQAIRRLWERWKAETRPSASKP